MVSIKCPSRQLISKRQLLSQTGDFISSYDCRLFAGSLGRKTYRSFRPVTYGPDQRSKSGPTRPGIVVYTDIASWDPAIAERRGLEQVVAYGSKKLSGAEDDWSATEGECWAAVYLSKRMAPLPAKRKVQIRNRPCGLNM